MLTLSLLAGHLVSSLHRTARGGLTVQSSLVFAKSMLVQGHIPLGGPRLKIARYFGGGARRATRFWTVTYVSLTPPQATTIVAQSMSI